MEISNNNELEYAIGLYLLKKRNEDDLLTLIKYSVYSIDGARDKIIKKIKKDKSYIQFLIECDQNEIIWNYIKKVKKNHLIPNDVHWLLFYASSETVYTITSYADELSIKLIMENIQYEMNKIDYEIYLSDQHYWKKIKTRYSKKKFYRKSMKLYKVCKKHLRTKC